MHTNMSDVVSMLDQLTPLEAGNLSVLVRQKWGIPEDVLVAPIPTVVPVTIKPVEQTEFTVTLIGHGPTKKMDMIRIVRAVTGLALKEAKEFVESIPKVVKEGLTRVEADALAKQLTDSGGIVTVG